MNILESAIRVKSKIIPYLHSPLVQVFFVGFIAILYLASFQLIVSGNDVAPVQFFHLSSDSMMQTIPIVQLWENPIESLYYLHIQPPLLDVIRALIVTFFVTSSDSGALVASMLSSKSQTSINDDSPLLSRVTWAILLGILAGVLLYAGGLTALQTSVVVTGVPFSIIVVFACRHFYKSLESELGN